MASIVRWPGACRWLELPGVRRVVRAHVLPALAHNPVASTALASLPASGAVNAGLYMQRLTDALDFQSQALVLRAERQRLIASNIANADTPGYQAREMDFANALRHATGTPTAVWRGSGRARSISPGSGSSWRQ